MRTLGGPKLEAKQLLNLAQTAGRMGQLLLQPDTVKGWDGGREWINDSTLLAAHAGGRRPVARRRTPPAGDAPHADWPCWAPNAVRPPAALRGLNPKQRIYLTLISPEFQLA